MSTPITPVDPEPGAPFPGDGAVPQQAIVTAQDGLDDLLAQLPPEIRVDYTYSLSHSVCVTALPKDLRRLQQLPMVKSIEPVRDVHHW